MAEELVRVPRSILEAIRRRGADPEAFVLDAVYEALRLDPEEELRARIDIAQHMLRRAREELERGDPVQASEKLYKATEEAIKVLACLEGLEECEKARREGGWWSRLLARAARKLARKHGSFILDAWSQAFDLHVHGFHEHSYSVEDVEETLPLVEKIVTYAAGLLRRRRA